MAFAIICRWCVCLEKGSVFVCWNWPYRVVGFSMKLWFLPRIEVMLRRLTVRRESHSSRRARPTCALTIKLEWFSPCLALPCLIYLAYASGWSLCKRRFVNWKMPERFANEFQSTCKDVINKTTNSVSMRRQHNSSGAKLRYNFWTAPVRPVFADWTVMIALMSDLRSIGSFWRQVGFDWTFLVRWIPCGARWRLRCDTMRRRGCYYR